jgi:hypothetical protein
LLPLDDMRLASLASIAFALLAACDGGGADDPRNVPQQHLPAPTAPKFTLYVSNQSFDLSQVDIRVSIDNQLAVTGDFLVEGQHTWVPFELDLAPGSHSLSVTSSDTNAAITEEFVMDDRKWGVLMFWYYEGGAEPVDPSFSWSVSDEQPAFQ